MTASAEQMRDLGRLEGKVDVLISSVEDLKTSLKEEYLPRREYDSREDTLVQRIERCEKDIKDEAKQRETDIKLIKKQPIVRWHIIFSVVSGLAAAGSAVAAIVAVIKR